MKKTIYLITTILLSAAALSLSSCLKDSRFVDFSKVGTIVEIPFGGQVYFAKSAVTDAGDTIVKQFAVNIASPTVPTAATTVTLSVNDPAIITKYNSANSAVFYEPMPAGSFVYTQTSVTIPGGQRSAALTVTFYKDKLDPSKSYMLPIAIKSAGGLNISGNMSIIYYHFIGNDFAGTYEHYYTRFEQPDTSAAPPSTNRGDEGPDIFSPVTPNEFVVITDYYTAPHYDVTFTKSGSGATATYSNWAIRFLPADISSGPWLANITVVTQPMFAPNRIAFDPNRQYTYAESLKLFRFYFTTASRAIFDEYIHN
jgi:hypothetical protein